MLRVDLLKTVLVTLTLMETTPPLATRWAQIGRPRPISLLLLNQHIEQGHFPLLERQRHWCTSHVILGSYHREEVVEEWEEEEDAKDATTAPAKLMLGWRGENLLLKLCFLGKLLLSGHYLQLRPRRRPRSLPLKTLRKRVFGASRLVPPAAPQQHLRNEQMLKRAF